MKKLSFIMLQLFAATQFVDAQVTPSDSSNSFTYRVLTTNLGYPWEITYGPDDSLWVTEARRYRIVKVSPVNGGKRTILDLNSSKNFTRNIVTSGSTPPPGTYARVAGVDHPWPQGGLMGLALHPQLLSGMPYIYVAYVYRWDSSSVAANSGEFFTTKIERYTYNMATKSLGSPVTIIDTLPGSSDHNSGRLTIGPDLKLYYSIGDMGAGQSLNRFRTHRGQNTNFYQGKILRFNTVQDADPVDPTDPFNKWIPNDNIYFNAVNGNQSAVYSYGHRNVQGMVWAEINAGDSLYTTEHGPQSDDELNVVVKGRNYGYPFVTGMCDGNMNGISNGPFTDAVSGANTEQNLCATYNIKAPISTFGTTNASPETDPEGSNGTWLTVAPSSTDFYGNSNVANQIPNWKNSILITTLKSGRLIRVKLNANGTGVTGSPVPYFRGANRFRDIALNPDGVKFYIATDSGYSTTGPASGTSSSSMPAYSGSIIEFTYAGGLLALHDDPSDPLNRKNEYRIFPNPVTESLTIQAKRNVAKPITCRLYDITGKFLLQQQTNSNDMFISMKGLGTGLYILKVFNGADANVVTTKIIKE